MAEKKRTSRTSSGARKAAKAPRNAAQQLQHQANTDAAVRGEMTPWELAKHRRAVRRIQSGKRKQMFDNGTSARYLRTLSPGSVN